MSNQALTPEQIAAWKNLAETMPNTAAIFAPLLPRVLTKPRPALPTEPGVYSLPAKSQADLGSWHTDGIELHYLNAEGNWSDVGWGNARDNEKRPFTRLVPEHPQVTAHQIADVLAEHGLPGVTRWSPSVQAVLALVMSICK